MKLIRRIEALERRAAAGGGARAHGIAWSSCESRLSDRQGAVAVDVHQVGEIVGVPEWRTVERPATGAGDLGWVYDSAGRVIGRVLSVRGLFVEVCCD